MTASNSTGVFRVWGKDQRSGVTTADGSATTISTMATGAKAVRFSLHLYLTAYTSGTATYTLSWTENSIAKSINVAASASNTPKTTTALAWPDDSTNVTIQLTGPFVATATIEAVVEVEQEGDFLLYVNDPNGLTQTAIDNAVSSGYTGIYLDANVTYTVSSTLKLGNSGGTEQPFILRSTMYGGAAAGDTDTPPANYINLTMTTGDGIHIPDNAAKVRLEGVAIVGNTTGACVHINGARESGLDNCYVKNTHSGSGYAVVIDASTGGADAEDNDSSQCYFKGWRALGIGVSDVTFHSNDCLWTAITTSGVDSGVYHVAGGNHTFIDWYDRSNPTTAAFNQTGGVAVLIGGEDKTTTTGGNAILLSGGQLWIRHRRITNAGATTDVSNTGGDLYLNGVQADPTTGYVLLQTGGTVTIGRDCYSTGATFTSNGGSIYYPTTTAHGVTPVGTGTLKAY